MTNQEAIIQLDYLKDFKTPDQVKALDMAIKALEQEPKTGHWIADVFVDKCSVCGEQTLFFEDQQKNFCPNCGADMRGDADEISD